MELLTNEEARLAQGYQAAGVWCGIKRAKKDLAILYSQTQAAAAGVFTKNVVQGAPVRVCREHLSGGTARALVINSGNANTCTGAQGLADATEMAAICAKALNVPVTEVYPVSTGVIGVPLPMDKIRAGIAEALKKLSTGGLLDAAWAILTTDSRIKLASVSFGPQGRYTLTGIAKGSGMIHPNMATMLAFLLTDAPVSRGVLQPLLNQVVDDTFNLISVDGDTSTNDSVLLLANGYAGGEEIDVNSPCYSQLVQALQVVCTYLAKEIARDGEGASKLITVRVTGAEDVTQARAVARAVSASNLVKTAVFGSDANWGRILCAAGYSGAAFDLEKIRVEIMGLTVFAQGQPVPFDEVLAAERLKCPEVTITLDLGLGEASATAFSCDFTYDYVKINASYRT